MAKTITVITETEGKYLQIDKGDSNVINLYKPEVSGANTSSGLVSFRDGSSVVTSIDIDDFSVGGGSVLDPRLTKLNDLAILVLEVNASAGAGSVTVTNFPAIQDVNVVSPIPLDVDTGLTQPLTDAQLRANAVPISGTVTANTGLTQPLTDAQLRASAVPVSNASLPLPTGASTSANQTTVIASLASIDAGTPAALGQTTMVNSMPVVIASNQTEIPVTGTIMTNADYGTDRVADNASPVTFVAIGTKYAVLGLDLNTTTGVNFKNVNSLITTSDVLLMQLVINPTVAGVFTYSAIPNSNCKQAIGGLTNTVTGGTVIRSVIMAGKDTLVNEFDLSKLNKITQTGTDKVVVVITPLTASVVLRTILNFKEAV